MAFPEKPYYIMFNIATHQEGENKSNFIITLIPVFTAFFNNFTRAFNSASPIWRAHLMTTYGSFCCKYIIYFFKFSV